MLFTQLYGKCQGKTRKDGARPAFFLIFVLLYIFFVLFCSVLCIVCVYMCTVLLPPGGYPIAVNKYIISQHPEDGEGISSRNIGKTSHSDAAVCPRKFD